MPSLPTPNSDAATWGDELNEYLRVMHAEDGTFKTTEFDLALAASPYLATLGGVPEPLELGDGDDLSYYQPGVGRLEIVKDGTAASPVTSGAGPTLKISRTEQVLESAMPGGVGSNNQGNAGLWVASKGNASTEAQVAAGLFSAESGSTQSAHNDDACAILGWGAITGSGTGTGIGAYLEGRRDTNTGKANGLEVAVRNYTNTAGAYTSSGFSNTTGIWLVSRAGNTATLNGVGLAIGNPDGVKFDVGIGFTSQGTGGPILTTSIRDDSSSVNSIQIKGTHTHALTVAAGAGKVLLGIESQILSTTLLEVYKNGDADPIFLLSGQGANDDIAQTIRNGSGSAKFGMVGEAGNYFTGTATGDLCIISSTSGKAVHLGGTTKVVTVTNANTLGFHAATPIAKPTVTGSRGGNAALASLLTALANYGLVTDSSSA